VQEDVYISHSAGTFDSAAGTIRVEAAAGIRVEAAAQNPAAGVADAAPTPQGVQHRAPGAAAAVFRAGGVLTNQGAAHVLPGMQRTSPTVGGGGICKRRAVPDREDAPPARSNVTVRGAAPAGPASHVTVRGAEAAGPASHVTVRGAEAAGPASRVIVRGAGAAATPQAGVSTDAAARRAEGPAAANLVRSIPILATEKLAAMVPWAS